uniref:Uncharacterized protein n=1 Tax=Oryza brachyantha TaxID=4533 RepID=J3MVV5_ORYBR
MYQTQYLVGVRFGTRNKMIPMRLAGKVAVITGVPSGIGKATTAEFIRNSAKVIIVDVQDNLGRAVTSELGMHTRVVMSWTRRMSPWPSTSW